MHPTGARPPVWFVRRRPISHRLTHATAGVRRCVRSFISRAASAVTRSVPSSGRCDHTQMQCPHASPHPRPPEPAFHWHFHPFLRLRSPWGLGQHSSPPHAPACGRVGHLHAPLGRVFVSTTPCARTSLLCGRGCRPALGRRERGNSPFDFLALGAVLFAAGVGRSHTCACVLRSYPPTHHVRSTRVVPESIPQFWNMGQPAHARPRWATDNVCVCLRTMCTHHGWTFAPSNVGAPNTTHMYMS